MTIAQPDSIYCVSFEFSHDSVVMLDSMADDLALFVTSQDRGLHGPVLRIRCEAPNANSAYQQCWTILRDAWGTDDSIHLDINDALSNVQIFPAEDALAYRDLVTVTDIADMLGCSTQNAANMVKRDNFPEPWIERRRGTLYLRAHVEHWARTSWRPPGRPAGTRNPVDLTQVHSDLAAVFDELESERDTKRRKALSRRKRRLEMAIEDVEAGRLPIKEGTAQPFHDCTSGRGLRRPRSHGLRSEPTPAGRDMTRHPHHREVAT